MVQNVFGINSREKVLRGDGAENQFCFNWLVCTSRSFAAFDQIGEVLTDSLCVPKKLDTELVVFVPTHDGDFDGKRRFCFRRLDVQREVAAWCQGDGTLHAASRWREIEEGSFSRAIVGLDAGGVPDIFS